MLLYHDDLADINDPVYFHEFAAHAGRHGLQYLGEAEFHTMQDQAFPPEVVTALAHLQSNVVLKEQYLDFLRCRRFRQTLLCRSGLILKRDLHPEQIVDFFVESSAEPATADPRLDPGVVVPFKGPRGTTLQSDHPLTKAALLELRSVWPQRVAFRNLVAAARQRLGQPAGDPRDADGMALAEAILSGYSAGMLELSLRPSNWTAQASERPVLYGLVRAQLEGGKSEVTGLRHTSHQVSEPIFRALLLLLEGTRDRAAVVAELARRLDAGEWTLPAGTSRDQLAADVERGLADAARGGLLIA
jgi:hypothetical protein